MDIQEYRIKELNLSKKARILSVYRTVLGEYLFLSQATRESELSQNLRMRPLSQIETDYDYSESFNNSDPSSDFWCFYCRRSKKARQLVRLDGFYLALTIIPA